MNIIIADNPVTVAKCAKEHGLLDTDGCKQLKRTAKRERAPERLVKQAKLRSF